nr:MAG TPA: hypothetical protein [Caudoviricetes sp.]
MTPPNLYVLSCPGWFSLRLTSTLPQQSRLKNIIAII